MSQILIVEDDRTIREAIGVILSKEGYAVATCASAEEALASDSFEPDLLITDYRLPGKNGIELVGFCREKLPLLESIVITAFGSIDLAVEAVKKGASDFLTKPFSPDELLIKVHQLLQLRQTREQKEYLLEEIRKDFSDYEIIGNSEEMKKIYSLVSKVARSESTVLIQGESGTGKELIARFIHFHSRRTQGPFIKVNCAALAEGILESELFGHEKGAFTGSIRQRKGRFELADSGTIFLDEIGDLAPNVQVKLLRVLQEGEVERVGGEQTFRVNVRVLAATNRDLVSMVQKGTFREDLYYRLNVIPVLLPPLRKRKEDIPELVQFFLNRLARENNKKKISLDKEALQALLDYPWPGNIRELENVLERAVVLCDSDRITLNELPFIQETSPTLEQRKQMLPLRGNLDDRLAELEKLLIVEAMQEAKGIKTRAARTLGIKTSTLYYKLEKYGLI
jgi:two-component system response regulator HydG